MNDCRNAEIRDQLPDLLHDRLGGPARAGVLAHVATCADCQAELDLLRAARAMFDARTPRVDVSSVVGALPLAKPRPLRVERRRPMWTDWRIAAAVTLLVAGGSSIAVLTNDHRGPPASRDTLRRAPVAVAGARPDTASTNVGAQPTVAPAPNTTASPTAVVASDEETRGLGSSRLGELSEQQLQTLLGEIDQLQATPITEPEPVSLRVGGNQSTSPEGT